MTIRNFLYNWILTILTTSVVGGLITSATMLITENFDPKLLSFPVVFIGIFGLPALVLALPYALIMMSALQWANEKMKSDNTYLLTLHLFLCAIYLIGTYIIGALDGTPWPFMAIVGAFAIVGTIFMIKPIDERPFIDRLRHFKNIF